MATVEQPRLPLDRAVWTTGNPCPMPTLDPFNFPIVAATPHDWYRPRVLVSGCENPLNGATGGGYTCLFDPLEDAWSEIVHYPGFDPGTAGVHSHGAAVFHPLGHTGTLESATSTTAVIDKVIQGDIPVGAKLRITGGTGAGQERTVAASNDTRTVSGYAYPQLRGSATGSGTTGVTVAVPAATRDGDYMMTVVWGDLVATVTPPAGWSLLQDESNNSANAYHFSVWGRTASSEPANYTWTLSAANIGFAGTFVYSGVDGVDAVDGTQTSQYVQASIAGLTATRSNSLLVGFAGVNNGGSLGGTFPYRFHGKEINTPYYDGTVAVATLDLPDTSISTFYGPGASNASSSSIGVVLRPSITADHTVSRITSGRLRPAVRPGSTPGLPTNYGSPATLWIPAGVQDGDLMVVIFMNPDTPDTNTVTPPAGWTPINSTSPAYSMYMRGFYRIADSEPANYVWYSDTGGYVGMWAFEGPVEYVSYGAIYGTAFTTYYHGDRITKNRVGGAVIGKRRVGSGAASYINNAVPVSAWLYTVGSLYDLAETETPVGWLPYVYYPDGDNDAGYFSVFARATEPIVGTTELTVDSPWTVTPDATSTYELDTGSFWVWRGNASDPTWRWSRFDIATGEWEKKTSTDAVATPTFVGAEEARGTLTVNVPAGVQDGDLLLWFSNHARGPSTGTWTALFGWQSGSLYPTCYYRFASSEPASYNQSQLETTYPDDAVIVAYRNAGVPTANGTAATSWGSGVTPPSPTQPALLLGVFFGVQASQPGWDRPAEVLTRGVAGLSTPRSGSNGSAILCDEIDPSKALGSTDPSFGTHQYTFSGPWWASGANLVAIPGASPGMTNYGKADPSRQGGIHAATDSDDTIWLGGDAQTSLRKYVISTDTWSALAAHEPYTRPLRNVGGGMAHLEVDGDPYIFYWCPGEQQNAYDNVARLYAFDLTNNVWIDLFAQAGPGVMTPTQFSQLALHNGSLLFVPMTSRAPQVCDPARVDALLPTDAVGLIARPMPITSGATPFVLTYGDDVWLYVMEHTNVQAVQPLRCKVTGRDWV